MHRVQEWAGASVESISEDGVLVVWDDAATRHDRKLPLDAIYLLTDGQFEHKCPPGLDRELSTDAASKALMHKLGKKCPNCGIFIQKDDGCNVMM